MSAQETEGYLVARPNFDSAMIGIALLTGLSVVVTLLAVALTGLRFVHAEKFVIPVGGMAAFLLLINAYQYVRMPDNKKLIMLVNMVLVYLIMAINMMIFQYCMAMVHAYPINWFIGGADRALGFEWRQFSTLVDRVPFLAEFIGACYKNWMREFIVVFVILTYFAKYEELYDFTSSYIIAGMVTLSVSGFLDSRSFDGVAAYAIAGLHHPSGVSPAYLEKLDQLRRGVDFTFDFDRIVGLVAFPSFHAGAAVLLAVATRGLRYLWLPFLVFNVLVLIGTVTEGGHNFADVISGCAIAVAAVAVARALRRSGYERWMARAAALLLRRGSSADGPAQLAA
jgi:PAP2 superfamily